MWFVWFFFVSQTILVGDFIYLIIFLFSFQKKIFLFASVGKSLCNLKSARGTHTPSCTVHLLASNFGRTLEHTGAFFVKLRSKRPKLEMMRASGKCICAFFGESSSDYSCRTENTCSFWSLLCYFF